MGTVEHEQLLPIGSRWVDCSDPLNGELPVGQVVGDVGTNLAFRIGIEGRTRAAFDPHARRDIGKPVGVEHTRIFHQQRLPIRVRVVR